MSSPRPRKKDKNTHSQADDINFILADAHCFNEDLPFACSVEKQSDLGGGAREAAEKSARGHGTDEDSRVAGMTLHADSVAKDCAPRIRGSQSLATESA